MIFAFVSRLFVLVQYVIPKHAISRLTGTLSRLRLSWITHLAIRIFVKAYDVDMGEAAETDVRSYSSFNAFFTRALAPGARPLADEGAAIVSPADGIVSQIGTIDGTCIIQAKSIDYKLMDLFDGDDDL
ncbi:MAG: phosphatidylserine decarboxylase, partial [Gammaproteobacteria bacterium]